MKSQVALEYMILIGAFFLLVIPIFYYTLTESTKVIQTNKAESVVNTLARTADYLFALGPGSQDLVEINMPGNVERITIVNKEIVLGLGIYGDIADVTAYTKANVTGTILTSKGIRHITVKVLDNGIVEIGENE